MTDNKPTFLNKLVDEYTSPLSVTSFYHLQKDPNISGKLYEILGVGKEHFTNIAIETLDILEREETIKADWLDFKWKLSAFYTIQDVFDVPLYNLKDEKSLFHQLYFYYESKYLLTETIMCGLNGFTASIGLLLRLFLEFNILQTYFYRKLRESQDYCVLENYFKNCFNPSWNTILSNSMPSDNFCKPIKKRLDVHLKGLSQSSAHPYQPVYSPKHSGSFLPKQTLERAFFFHRISMILEPVLWLYFVNFPMLLHPVDVQRKFGFNSPVGLFIDKQAGEIIKRSIPEKDYKHFLDYSMKTDEYRSLTEFYSSRKDMSEDDIIATWNEKSDGPLKSIRHGHCIQMVKMRGLKEIMALKLREELSHSIDKISEMLNYDKWKDYYRKVK